MTRKNLAIAAVLLTGLWATLAYAVSPQQSKSAAPAGELSEKEKALANPYPNDLGPDALSEGVLKSYPTSYQEGYHILIGEKKDAKGKWVSSKGKSGCVQCHSAARPLNSRFLEPEGGTDDKKQEAALAKLKKDQPEIFKDPSIWQPEVKIFNRYVKRMMNKPGCSIDKKEGKAIWEFLAYDGVQRKTGANAAKWAEHRKGLVSEFKTKYKARYEELAAQNDL